MNLQFFDSLHADPWTEHFVDLQALNASASDSIEQAVQRALETGRADPRALRSSSIVVLGPPGAGKTHLFTRLRRRLGPRAMFVHVRPLLHAPMSPRFVLGEIVNQLAYSTGGQQQLSALVGSLLSHLSGASQFPRAFLSEYERLQPGDRELRLVLAVEQVLELWPEVDDSYLERLLQAPFANPRTQRALLAWLSGHDCDATHLSRIGATASLGEERIVPALRTLCAVASLGAPIVLVFDQLENLIEASEAGERLLGYANLAAELVDSMRGLVLVHMALDTEWSRGIEPSLSLSQKSRLIMNRETLALPNANERADLLRLWIDQLPERQAPYPWPFGEAHLKRVMETSGMTPRMLMVECRNALSGNFTDNESSPDAARDSEQPDFSTEWEECLDEARQEMDKASERRSCVDASRLADGLLACSQFVSPARLTSRKGGDAQLTLSVGGITTSIAFIAQGHHRSVATAIDRLSRLAEQGPVVAIRERTHELPPTWSATIAKRQALLQTSHARWLLLDTEDLSRLLALDALLQQARSGDITDQRGVPVKPETVITWISASLNVPSWEIVKSLLSEEAGEEQYVEASPPSAPAEPLAPSVQSGSAITLMRLLRVASVDRVVREAARLDPKSSRAGVLSELMSRPDEVRFYGRNVVCVRTL